METTREEAHRKSHDATVNALNALLEKNYDAELGYKNALTDVKSDNLKTYFMRQAAHRSQYANELDASLRLLNATPVEKGSATAAAHRTWMDFKTAFTGKNDEAILEECIRGDKAAVQEYKDVLENQDYLHEYKDVVRNQLSGIENTLQTKKGLEDIVD
ncbi:MAG: PA2169 family four-helix-bundle protein [Nonlabens ulvanivorans]|uniref:ferritin-like domain-containing protein n=1 Tax=Nonlabens ulvanivorans TaxID=906888 RepID=UPI003298A7E0